jgi:hypothetical protein
MKILMVERDKTDRGEVVAEAEEVILQDLRGEILVCVHGIHMGKT